MCSDYAAVGSRGWLERRHLERENRSGGMPEEVNAPRVDRDLRGDLRDDVVQEERAVLGRCPV